MKKNLLIIFFSLLGFSLTFGHSQNENIESSLSNMQRNSFYVELLGIAGMISINYKRLVPLSDKNGLGFRVGVGSADALTGLVEVNLIHGKSKHFLETGIGYVDAFNYPDQWISIKLGYRYQAKKGFLFKIAPMYIYNFEKAKGNHDVFSGIWAGAGFGYSF